MKAAEQLLQTKQGSRPDLLQAQIQLNLARSSVQDARYRHEAAWRQLVSVVGTPCLAPMPLIGSLEGDFCELDWGRTLQELLELSPLVKAQLAEIETARSELKLAQAQAIPNLNVQLVAQGDSVMKFSSVSTLLSMPIPIFNRNQGNIRNAEGRLHQQEKELERQAGPDGSAGHLLSPVSEPAQPGRAVAQGGPAAGPGEPGADHRATSWAAMISSAADCPPKLCPNSAGDHRGADGVEQERGRDEGAAD